MSLASLAGCDVKRRANGLMQAIAVSTTRLFETELLHHGAAHLLVLVIQLKLLQVGLVFSRTVASSYWYNIWPVSLKPGIAYLFIFVFVIIKDTIAICIDHSTQHKLNLVLEVDDITHIGEKSVRPAGFVERPDIGRDPAPARFEEKELCIAFKKLRGVVFGDVCFRKAVRTYTCTGIGNHHRSG